LSLASLSRGSSGSVFETAYAPNKAEISQVPKAMRLVIGFVLEAIDAVENVDREFAQAGLSRSIWHQHA